ncbi:MBL fold metallo-hydrolase [Natronoglycomyces albus]|uniref:MBL fold metallo-hydrolase n=1 Tax=Natronoglycomyces albus TaxID=2811108 RepID=A0A895XJL2_9ACTN|nr:MBL fold metallo-hydrolase [Natronoglycomyces albus]QSB04002.1 MBL fold metallo-hydrolase [Natronoglycomyces albus]
MLIDAVTSEIFGTNCYVIAPSEGAECLVIDPGIGVGDQLGQLLEARSLTPAAILLTHGHMDHTHSAAAVSDSYGVPVLIHAEDAHQLVDPFSALGPLGDMARQLGWTEPKNVEVFSADTELEFGSLRVSTLHAPGHTSGSTLFSLAGDETVAAYCFTGDVLFASTIGRTDLPTGDDAQMRHTLATVLLPMDDATVFLPGHGERTTMDRERRSNPFLRDVAGHSSGR